MKTSPLFFESLKAEKRVSQYEIDIDGSEKVKLKLEDKKKGGI